MPVRPSGQKENQGIQKLRKSLKSAGGTQQKTLNKETFSFCFQSADMVEKRV